MSPPTWPLPLMWGSKTWKKRGKWVFPLSNDKTLLWSFSDQKLPAAKLFVHLSGRHWWRNFQNRCIITLFISISVHPLHWRKSATFKQLCFRNGCIDLNVRYTVGKDMTRSTSWRKFVREMYHLQGQFIADLQHWYAIGYVNIQV